MWQPSAGLWQSGVCDIRCMTVGQGQQKCMLRIYRFYVLPKREILCLDKYKNMFNVWRISIPYSHYRVYMIVFVIFSYDLCAIYCAVFKIQNIHSDNSLNDPVKNMWESKPYLLKKLLLNCWQNYRTYVWKGKHWIITHRYFRARHFNNLPNTR